MKLFSTKTHGVLDYVSGSTLLVLPSVLGMSPTVTSVVRAMGLTALGSSLLTRYELGVFKVLSMPAHLTLDALSGALFCAVPFLFPDEDNTVKGTLFGMGVFEIFAALTTETTPSLGEQASQLGDSLSSTTQNLGDTIYDAANNLQQRSA